MAAELPGIKVINLIKPRLYFMLPSIRFRRKWNQVSYEIRAPGCLWGICRGWKTTELCGLVQPESRTSSLHHLPEIMAEEAERHISGAEWAQRDDWTMEDYLSWAWIQIRRMVSTDMDEKERIAISQNVVDTLAWRKRELLPLGDFNPVWTVTCIGHWRVGSGWLSQLLVNNRMVVFQNEVHAMVYQIISCDFLASEEIDHPEKINETEAKKQRVE